MLQYMYIACLIDRLGLQLKLGYTKRELKCTDLSVSGTWYFVKNKRGVVLFTITFTSISRCFGLWNWSCIQELITKNAHNVVKCKEISLQMTFTTVKTNLSFLDVCFSSSVVYWLDFESGSQEG